MSNPFWNAACAVGLVPPEPKFITVLSDKQVERSGNITLICESNTQKVTTTWMKNGQNLDCEEGKHTIKTIGRKHTLTIVNADEGDDGRYTLTLKNISGGASCSSIVTVALKPWRTISKKADEMVKFLQDYKVCTSEVKELRFLLYGPIGAGKSSTINTIKTIFEGRQFVNCLVDADNFASKSYTLKYQKYTIGGERTGELPFAFYDVMGLEDDVEFVKNINCVDKKKCGVHPDDIIKALKGHIQNDYEFKISHPITEDSKHYIRNPSLSDTIHCLVNVIPADKFSLMSNGVTDKLKIIRDVASKLGIPQIVFMTRVDKACPQTHKDLTMIYKSKTIKEKMTACSIVLGIPMNCIFPVKNYHEETEMNETINCLMLNALTQSVHSANDYVKRCSYTQEHKE